MATNLDPNQVAAEVPVATAAPQPTLAPITASQVYDPTNIQQINIPSTSKAMDMKLSDLEKKLSKANSIADLNQIAIMNQPKAMGVITGEAAYRDKLDTARVNAFNNLYNNRLLKQQRDDAKKAQFIATYGADPSKRPKGMSEREFVKALSGGRFSHLLTEDFKQKQLQTAAAQKSLSGGGTGAPGANKELAATADAFTKFNGDWGQTANYLASQGYDVSSGSAVDNELRRRNNLPPIVAQKPLTASEQATLDASKPDPVKTEESLKNLDIAIASAESHAGASGRSGIRQKAESWFVGATDYTNLVAETNTIRTNILTLATDPTIKKFFGPQMSNADVQLMTSAGTMLNPELQSPEQLKKSLAQAKNLIARARNAVNQGISQASISDEEAYAQYLKIVK